MDNLIFSFGRVNSAFDILLKAVQKHQKNPVLLVLVAKKMWSIWMERNLRVFQGNERRIPLQVLFQNRAEKVLALEATIGRVAMLASLRENCLVLQRCAAAMRGGMIVV
jgi:hypothetical protein